MKEVTTKLYRYSELSYTYKLKAKIEYDECWLKTNTPIEDIWFTVGGLIFPVFQFN